MHTHCGCLLACSLQAEKEQFERELREKNEAELLAMETEHEAQLLKEKEKAEERLKVTNRPARLCMYAALYLCTSTCISRLSPCALLLRLRREKRT